MIAIYKFQYISPQSATLYENVEVIVEDTTLIKAEKQADGLIDKLRYKNRRLMQIITRPAMVSYHEQSADITGRITEKKE